MNEIENPKATIITVVYNRRDEIRATIESVLGQDYSDLEYIVIDGASTDGTREEIERFAVGARIVSERDRGMYDALNKGVALATGSVVGILHSGDLFSSPDAVTRMMREFAQSGADIVFGDSVFTSDKGKVVRYYSGAGFRLGQFAFGMMPPHTATFVRRSVFSKFGNYDIRWKIAADFDLLLRFMLLGRVPFRHVPFQVCQMSLGGISTRGVSSNLTLNREIRAVCRLHGVKTSYLRIYSKYLVKVWQFVKPRLSFLRSG